MIHQQARDPERVKILGICDPHLCIHNPPVYKVNYWPTIKTAVERVFQYAVEQEADLILWAGDIFHLKGTGRNPNAFMKEVLDLLRLPTLKGIRHATIAGNHDVSLGSLEGLKNQPLNVLIGTGWFPLLDIDYLTIQGKDFTVRIGGRSYEHGRAEATRALEKGTADWLIAVGHFWFASTTGEMFGEAVFGPDFLGKGEADAYLIGHHHEDQGIRRIDGKWYFAQGSITKTGSHKADIERKPAAVWIEVTKEEMEAKILRTKFPPASELFDLERREQIKQEQVQMEDYMRELAGATFGTSDPHTILEQMGITDQVRIKVREYLEAAETDG